MKKGYNAGFKALPFEDFAITKSQGAITDRTKEHLGASDIAVIGMRRLMVDMIKDFQAGNPPRLFRQKVDYPSIRAVHEVVMPEGKVLEVSQTPGS